MDRDVPGPGWKPDRTLEKAVEQWGRELLSCDPIPSLQMSNLQIIEFESKSL